MSNSFNKKEETQYKLISEEEFEKINYQICVICKEPTTEKKTCTICELPTQNKKIVMCGDCLAKTNNAEVELYIKVNWAGKENV